MSKMCGIIDYTGCIIHNFKVCYLHGFAKNQHTEWICLCNCGNYFIVNGSHLKDGNVKSCGCLQIKLLRKRSVTHGFSFGTVEQRSFLSVYQAMKYRCIHLEHKAYPKYGGRGITVCPRWLEAFENFRDDMWESYLEHIKEFGKNNTSLDRVNNDLLIDSYSKANCKWATRKEQQGHRRNSVITENRELYYYWKSRLFSIMHRVIRAAKWNINIPDFIKYFGCTPKEFKRYIESLWEPWMNWGNLGFPNRPHLTWNIDHIIPIYKFDLSKEEDRKKCWNYKNLRPLEASINFSQKVRNS